MVRCQFNHYQEWRILNVSVKLYNSKRIVKGSLYSINTTERNEFP